MEDDVKFDVSIDELISCGLKGELNTYQRVLAKALETGGAVRTRFEEKTMSWHYDIIPPHDLYAEPDDQNPLKK